MSENYPKFWTLTYDMFKNDVKKLEDNLIILVHWVLLKNDFQMLGHTNKVKCIVIIIKYCLKQFFNNLT